MENKTAKQDPYAIMKVLWLAFLSSTGVFILVMFSTVKEGGVDSSNPNIRYILGGLGVFMAVLSFQIPRFFRQQLSRQHKGLQLSREKKAQLDFIPTIISFALSESVGIFGLVLALITGSREIGLPLCIASVVLLAIHKPKKRF